MVARPVHVLFLDDDLTMLVLLRMQFFNSPYGVALTKDPAEALRIMAREPIKVAIVDYEMPGMNGIDFFSRMKTEHPDIVRILLTGHEDFKVAKQALNDAQVYRYLTKPCDYELLKVAVRQAIELFDSVTERRELAVELQRKNEELRALNKTQKFLYEKQKEITSTVSHELRTPLAAIKMALDIITREMDGLMTEEQKGFLHRAKMNVDRLHRLINSVLDLTKMEAGKLSLKVVQGDIMATVMEAVETQRVVAESKGLSLVVRQSGRSPVPQLMFEKDRIMQVLFNLLSNAIKFTESGGITVTVEVPEGKNFLTVGVKDTGPGIKAEDMGRLFEKFEQLEGNSNNKAGGTGLGLAICKNIIDCHGGKIWAESVWGQGTEIFFLLPIEERREGKRL